MAGGGNNLGLVHVSPNNIGILHGGGFTVSPVSYTPGALTKVAFRYNSSGQAISMNGSAVSATTETADTFLSAGELAVGSNLSSPDNPINSPIKLLYYIPRALSDGELQSVTAL